MKPAAQGTHTTLVTFLDRRARPQLLVPTVLQTRTHAGMFNVLDMVLNHVGYGSSIFLPPFNPFSDPGNFNNCTSG